MEWTDEIRHALAAPFPEEEIGFLPRAANGNRALALAHVDARSVQNRLDSVVGPAGWSFDYFVIDAPIGKKVKGELTVLGVTKCDAGEADREDEPLKSAVSDAIKRCAVHFGIARYLYYLPQIWGNFDQQKRRFSETPQLPHGALEKALATCGYRGPMPAPVVVESRSQRQPTPQANREPAAPRTEREIPAPSRIDPPARAPHPQVDTDERPAQRAGAGYTEGGAVVPQAPSSGAMVCATAGCGKPLTKGQHDVSMRAFGSPFCPACQRQQSRAA